MTARPVLLQEKKLTVDPEPQHGGISRIESNREYFKESAVKVHLHVNPTLNISNGGNLT